MKKQLQGISLILFAAVLMLYAMIDPWIPIISDIPTDLLLSVPWSLALWGLCGLSKRETDRSAPEGNRELLAWLRVSW